MLILDKVSAGYGKIKVIKRVSLEITKNKIISIIGANGAGKTTLLRVISGMVPCGEGRIYYKEKEITGLAPQKIVRLGVRQVLEGRQIFGSLSVMENLKLGCFICNSKNKRLFFAKEVERVFEIFPRLKERKTQLAGTMSGGEQQMLAIGRAIIARPDLLILDEPSLGLAPMVVSEILRVVTQLRKEKVTIMLVEQRARLALEISDYGYVLELGKIVLQEEAHKLLNDVNVQRAYLGEANIYPEQ